MEKNELLETMKGCGCVPDTSMYVSKEQAWMLASLGYAVPTVSYRLRDPKNEEVYLTKDLVEADHNGTTNFAMSAPTLFQVVDWLTKMHHILVNVVVIHINLTNESCFKTDVIDSATGEPLLHPKIIKGYRCYMDAITNGVTSALGYLLTQEPYENPQMFKPEEYKIDGVRIYQ